MDDFLHLMEQLDHAGVVVKFGALATLIWKVFASYSKLVARFEALEKKSDRNHKLMVDILPRVRWLEKYVTGKETLIPEETPEREEMREHAKDIVTGRFKKPDKPKGGGS